MSTGLFAAAEIEGLIQDTGGVEVWLSGSRTWGHLRRETQADLGTGFQGEVAQTVLTLTVATGRLSGLVDGAFLRVGTQEGGSAANGTLYRAVTPMEEGIGKTRMVLAEVSGG